MTAAPWGCFYNGQPPNCCEDLGFFVRRGTDQSIPNNTETLVDFTTIVEENPAGTFDLTNDQFVCTVPGRYAFSWSADLTFSANGFGEVRLYEGATLRTDSRAESDLNARIRIGCSIILKLSVGDVMQARVYQSSGLAAILNLGQFNQFTGGLISRP